MKNGHDFWNTRFKISATGSRKKYADLDEKCHSYCSWVSCKKNKRIQAEKDSIYTPYKKFLPAFFL